MLFIGFHIKLGNYLNIILQLIKNMLVHYLFNICFIIYLNFVSLFILHFSLSFQTITSEMFLKLN